MTVKFKNSKFIVNIGVIFILHHAFVTIHKKVTVMQKRKKFSPYKIRS
jgi:hypothetical protein